MARGPAGGVADIEAGRVTNERDRAWQHLWLRISLLFRAMLGTHWDAKASQQIRPMIPEVTDDKQTAPMRHHLHDFASPAIISTM